jgi:hypothetical protein
LGEYEYRSARIQVIRVVLLVGELCGIHYLIDLSPTSPIGLRVVYCLKRKGPAAQEGKRGGTNNGNQQAHAQ